MVYYRHQISVSLCEAARHKRLEQNKDVLNIAIVPVFWARHKLGASKQKEQRGERWPLHPLLLFCLALP